MGLVGLTFYVLSLVVCGPSLYLFIRSLVSEPQTVRTARRELTDAQIERR